jgi:hypothetical protein
VQALSAAEAPSTAAPPRNRRRVKSRERSVIWQAVSISSVAFGGRACGRPIPSHKDRRAYAVPNLTAEWIKKGKHVAAQALLHCSNTGPIEGYLMPSNPSSEGRISAGGKSRYSSGWLLRLIQTVRKPNLVAPATSQRLDDWNDTAFG